MCVKTRQEFFNQGQAWNTTLKRLGSLASQGIDGRLRCATPRSQHQSKQRETFFIPKEHMCCIRRAVDQDPCKQALLHRETS